MNEIVDLSGAGGGKGGSSSSANKADTLRSQARGRLVVALSEGPIFGLVDGSKSIFRDQTPLVNANGSENTQNVEWQQHKGYADEGFFRGHSDVGTVISVGATVGFDTGPVTRTIVGEEIDAVRVIVRLNSLFKIDSDSGDLKPNSVGYVVEVRTGASGWLIALTANLNDHKTSSPVQFQHRIPLDGDGPWDVRVRRTTADDADDKSQSEFDFDSYVTIVEGKFSYPHTAAVALEFNAEDVGGDIGALGFEVKGRLIKVPTNYNADAHTYSGIWDGTFKTAYSTCPPWIYYDMVTSNRFGIGDFVKNTAIDKWSLYTIARWCDGLVPSGQKNASGGIIYENRYTFNGVISGRRDAFEVLRSITTVWRGMAYWNLGQMFATADMPADPVALVSPANVLDGEFIYSSTALKARSSVVLVKWNDPDDFYRAAVEPVLDDEMVQKFGWREKSVDLPGCTSQGMAHRYGRWLLDVERNETETVTYKAGLDHVNVVPGSIIAVSDPRKAAVRRGGRIVSSTASNVVLDAPFVKQGAHTYTIKWIAKNGSVIEKNVVSVTGNTVATGALTTAEQPLADANYAIIGTDVQPRQYRVIAVSESQPTICEVTATFHDPDKYARVERGLVLKPRAYVAKQGIPKPSNLTIVETGVITNVSKRTRLQISWTPPSSPLVIAYAVTINTPISGTLQLPQTVEPVSQHDVTEPGVHTITVRSISVTGAVSEPLTLAYTVKGDQGFGDALVRNLKLKDSNGLVFEGRDARLTWENVFPTTTAKNVTGATSSALSSPLYSHSIVKVYRTDSNALLRTQRVTTPSYTYDFATNKTDNQNASKSPCRALRFEVQTFDVRNRYSNIAQISVSNPVPAAVVPKFSQIGETITTLWDMPNEQDVTGARVWIETNSTFVPDSTTPKFDAMGGQFSFMGVPLQEYFVRVGVYDSFGKTGLNVTTPFSVSTGRPLLGDFAPPATPTNLQLTTTLKADGRSVVVATWAASASADRSSYDLLISEAGGNEVSFETTTLRHEIVAQPGLNYTVRVRAVDRLGNTSSYTGIKSIIGAKDSTAPAKPVSLAAVGTFGGFWLTWTANTETDLARYEIYESASNTAPVALTVATFVSVAATFVRTGVDPDLLRYFWVRAVDTSGNASLWSTAVSATTPASVAITNEAIAGLVDATSFASSIKPIEVVSILPGTPHVQGRQVFLKTDNKTYRNTGSGWTAAIPAADVSGQLTSLQIADAAITTAKFASTIKPVEILAALPGIPHVLGRQVMLTTDNKLYRNTGAGWTAAVPAADVTGKLADAQIAAVSATKLTGQVAASQIAALDASKVTGTLTNAQIEAVAAAKLTGQITGTQITDGAVTTEKVFAGAITAGTIATDAIIAGKIATDAITAREIVAGSISAAEIAAGTITAVNIAAGAITASKMTISDTTNLWPDFGFVDESLYTMTSGTLLQFIGTAASQLGQKYISVTNAAGSAGLESRWQECTPGSELLVSGAVWLSAATGGATASLDIEFATLGSTGVLTPVRLVNVGSRTDSTSATALSVNMTVAPSERRFRFVASRPLTSAQALRTGGWLVQRRANGSLIVDGSITAGKILAGTITADEIATGTITAVELATDSVIAGKIAAGAVTATEIASGSITTSKMTIMDRENLYPDGGFEDGDISYYSLVAASNGVARFSTTNVSGSSALELYKSDLTKTVSVYTQESIYSMVLGGATYWAETEAKTGGSVCTAGFYYRVRWYNSSKVYIGQADIAGNAGLDSNWQIFQKQVVAPALACYAGWQLINNVSNSTVNSFFIDRVVLRRANAGSLVVDGTITADHIAINSINAGHIVTGTITANEIGTDAITSGKIKAGAVGADQIAANAIVASKVLVQDRENLLQDGGFEEKNAGNFSISLANVTFSTTNVTGSVSMSINKAVLTDSASLVSLEALYAPVKAGEIYWAESEARTLSGVATAGFYARIRWYDKAKVFITYTDIANNTGLNTAWQVFTKKAAAPALACFAGIQLYNHSTNTVVATFLVDRVVLKRANAAELIVDGTIKANHIDVNSLVVTGLANINTAYIKEANIVGTLSAAKITAGSALLDSITINGTALSTIKAQANDPAANITALPDTITVGGTALSTIKAQANDPAARVNAAATLITPGKIQISGATTLSSWQMGTDATKINGGSISANTISANKLEIGSRGVTLTAIEWEHNKPLLNQASWTAGAIRYTDNGGTEVSTAIAAGSVTWTTGIQFIYWVYGGTTFLATTTQATAQGADRLILATYEGGVKLDADFGRTIIDGSKIKTGTITADQILAGTITATQIAANTISANKLEIGSRGVTLTAIEWEHNKPAVNQASWTAGQIRYTDNAGTEVSSSIAAGAVTWTAGVQYIYWIYSGTTFSVTTVQTTAQGNDRLILATYEGGVNLDADYGRTIIDGSKIKTGTITASQIAANTISANKLEIGSRGVTLTAIEWEHNKPLANQASWTAGQIRYTDNGGTEVSTAIAAGSVTWTTGVQYIYWIYGGATFLATTAQATAQGNDRLILATYEGGVKLDADYGRTIIDGSKIKTGTVTANRLVTGTITAASGIIGNLAVDTAQIAGNAVTAGGTAYTIAGQTLTTGVWKSVVNVNVQRSTGLVTEIQFSCDVAALGINGGNAIWYRSGSLTVLIQRNGVNIIQRGLNLNAVYSDTGTSVDRSYRTVGQYLNFIYIDTSTGTNLANYTVSFLRSAVSTNSSQTNGEVISSSILTARQFKR